MSAINDALSKVQQNRKEVVAPKASNRTAGRPSPTSAKKSGARTPLYVWFFANITALVLVWAGYQLFFRQIPVTQGSPVVSLASITPPRDSKASPASPVVTTAPELVRVTPAPESRSTTSPRVTLFPEATVSDVEYDLSGMTTVGTNTLLSITRRSDRTSFWISVGKTVGEVTAVSYNPETNDAVIRVRDRLVTIRRR